MPTLNGKTVLITGSAGGFGRELTRQLLLEGSMLILSDRTLAMTQCAAAEVAAGLGGRKVPGRILGFVAADLASPEGAAHLAAQARAVAPQIDVLINNAGLSFIGAFADVPQDRWELIMQVNLLAPMRLTALLLPEMIARGGGHVVNIASCAGLAGTPSLVAYCASKFGLRGFGEALGNELRDQGIRVTTLYPYFARTPILDSEHFGSRPTPALPTGIDEPDMVIRELIAGLKAGRQHIYPGRTAKLIYQLQKPGPWLLPKLIRATGQR
ncbi:MAG: SDR family NAD(P)-dependent oxidoreductase [Roseiflexaceae bacterium]|nr:SDR family NAD(P)-dependent oxidoreductase [Roseiflexaceae bacterium]